jgi:hypothetical protein
VDPPLTDHRPDQAGSNVFAHDLGETKGARWVAARLNGSPLRFSHKSLALRPEEQFATM